jgi:N-acetylmuramoyl-L-alanine amidase
MRKLFFFLVIFTFIFCEIGINVGVAKTRPKTICIDPGHQYKQNLSKEPLAPGSKTMKSKVSSGTRGIATKKSEYELNLEVALQLSHALLKKGYRVYLTRSKHKVNISNVQRAVYCNQKKADLTIRIHADGSTNRNVQGISVLYPTGKSTTKLNKRVKRLLKKS